MSPVAAPNTAFEHFALLYEGDDGFVARTLPFLREGVKRGEPTLVMTSARKCELLSRELADDAEAIDFRDMAEVGRNPARIIPAWRGFAERHPDRTLRGIGEPIWAGRSSAELVECQHHESLLNLAFADARDFRLLCPYDVAALPAEVVAGARRTHPGIDEHGAVEPCGDYVPPLEAPGPFTGTLAPIPAGAAVTHFGTPELANVRAFLSAWARCAGLTEQRAADLVLAVHELATNSVRHGGGTGTLFAWREEEAVFCEVRDSGRFTEPLAGRSVPAPTAPSGRGLWLANQLCDLVQIRTDTGGSAVRVQVALTAEPDPAR